MMQIFKATSAVTLLTMVCLLSFNSQAASFPTLSAGDHTYYSYNLPGKFTDRWDFSLAEDSSVSVKITDFEIKGGLFGFDIVLLDNKKLQGVFDGTTFGTGEWFTRNLLAGVDYSLFVTGKAAGWLGGKYKLDANVAPVPVPAALGLFVVALAGFFRFAKRSTAVTA